jgi:hypothetical protein
VYPLHPVVAHIHPNHMFQISDQAFPLLGEKMAGLDDDVQIMNEVEREELERMKVGA